MQNRNQAETAPAMRADASLARDGSGPEVWRLDRPALARFPAGLGIIGLSLVLVVGHQDRGIPLAGILLGLLGAVWVWSGRPIALAGRYAPGEGFTLGPRHIPSTDVATLRLVGDAAEFGGRPFPLYRVEVELTDGREVRLFESRDPGHCLRLALRLGEFPVEVAWSGPRMPLEAYLGRASAGDAGPPGAPAHVEGAGPHRFHTEPGQRRILRVLGAAAAISLGVWIVQLVGSPARPLLTSLALPVLVLAPVFIVLGLVGSDHLVLEQTPVGYRLCRRQLGRELWAQTFEADRSWIFRSAYAGSGVGHLLAIERGTGETFTFATQVPEPERTILVELLRRTLG